MRDIGRWIVPMLLTAIMTTGCATAPTAPTAVPNNVKSVNQDPTQASAELPRQEPIQPATGVRNAVAVDEHAPPLRNFTVATRSGRLQHPGLTEVSGMISSMRSPGILFAVNDSGNSATLYALQDDGKHRAQWRIDARNRDWEDMSRVQANGKNYLVIGDTGDNLKIHRRSTLHLLEEPALNTATQNALSPAYSINFTFEDGPRNVEAFGIVDETVYLITKEPVSAQGPQASRLYTLPLSIPPATSDPVALYAGDLWVTKPNLEARLAASLAGVDLNHPTALDFHASGTRAYMLTYRHVVRFTRAQHESWADAFAQAGTRIHTHDLEQAEALAVDSGRAVFITSEHASAPLWALPDNPPL